MFRYLLIFVLIFSVHSVAAPLPADEITDALAHAEALYYEARFTESVQLLLRIDTLLQSQPERLREKTSVKLQLALAHIGLNDVNAAQSYLRELFALDADYQLDPKEFSPKVLTLAADAKLVEDQNRCKRIQANAQQLLELRDTKTLTALISSRKAVCPDLDVIEPHVAELLYADGLAQYKRGEMDGALRSLQGALALDPRHELAAQYLELVQTKAQISQDRAFLEWQKRLATGDFAAAATHYHELTNDTARQSEMRTHYRALVESQVQSWKQACASGNQTEMGRIAKETASLLPDASIAPDLVGQMRTCNSNQCVQMTSQVALARLQSRVNPVFRVPPRGPLNVRVQMNIDEKGSVKVRGIKDGGPMFDDAIRNAMEQWKFSPLNLGSGARCVDTELPLTIRPTP